MGRTIDQDEIEKQLKDQANALEQHNVDIDLVTAI